MGWKPIPLEGKPCSQAKPRGMKDRSRMTVTGAAGHGATLKNLTTRYADRPCKNQFISIQR